MIAFVRGKVAVVRLTSVVLDVGGVGYELYCTPNTLAGLHVGREALLPTAMVVREDSMTLYGFANDDERQMFELVQIAGGVGPKLAQAILAVLSPDGLRVAIANDDAATLTQVPGIGQRSAQRIILELKDRVGAPAGAAAPATGAAAVWRLQVREGLMGLGYSHKDADRAIDAVAEGVSDDEQNVGAVLRQALQVLSKK